MNEAAHAQWGGGEGGLGRVGKGRMFYMHQQHGICIPAVLFSTFFEHFFNRACTKEIEMTSATHVRTGR